MYIYVIRFILIILTLYFLLNEKLRKKKGWISHLRENTKSRNTDTKLIHVKIEGRNYCPKKKLKVEIIIRKNLNKYMQSRKFYFVFSRLYFVSSCKYIYFRCSFFPRLFIQELYFKTKYKKEYILRFILKTFLISVFFLYIYNFRIVILFIKLVNLTSNYSMVMLPTNMFSYIPCILYTVAMPIFNSGRQFWKVFSYFLLIVTFSSDYIGLI